MKRRDFLAYVCAGLVMAQPAVAGDLEESVLSQLRDQGFATIRRSRTLLGRTRLVAEGKGVQREIILNPRTGEILRDFWKTKDESRPTILRPQGDDGEGSSPDDGGDDSPDDGGDDSPDDGGDDDGGDDDGGDDDKDDDEDDDEDDNEEDDEDDDRGWRD